MIKTVIKFILVTMLFSTYALSVENHTESIPVSKPNIEKEIHCLSLNLHHEARGESIEGIRAVAHVTLNRVKSGKFANSICKVIKQPGQFSWVGTELDRKNISIDPKLKQIAFETLVSNTRDNTGGALYFHNRSVEGFKKRITAQIDNHIFYR
jgi:spore germination cell wall hydrolase CwlJ-like protein